MVDNVESERIRAFVQRWCAISEDASPSGYFAFYGGAGTVARAKVLCDRVPWGERAPTEEIVLQRIGMLAEEGHRIVWLRAYATGSSNHQGALKVTTDAEEEEDELTKPEKGGGGAALANAHARVVTALARVNVDLMTANGQLHERLAETQTAQALYQLAALTAQDSSHAAMVGEAIRALAPTVEAVIPTLLAEILRRSAERPTDASPPPTPETPPDDPGSAIDWHLDRLERAAAGLQSAVGAHPTAFIRARQMRVIALLRRFGVEIPDPPGGGPPMDG